MLNSVAKYFWGGSSDSGHNQVANNSNLEQQQDREGNLEIHQEEDWLIVQAADKENDVHLAHCTQLICQHQGQTTYSQSVIHAGHDSLSQNSSSASEAELLDEASALAQTVCVSDHGLPTAGMDNFSDSVICPLHDFGWANEDIDKYSDTDSIPESVFSACSGQSHATYHPCGSQSEPWVVAPPPCFTGSQVENLLPVASSPLENLLIEHPSMSVYHSFPPTHPILSNRPTKTTDPIIVGLFQSNKPNANNFTDDTAGNSLKEKNINNLKEKGSNSLKEKNSSIETNYQQPANDFNSNRVTQTEASSNALPQRNLHVYTAIHSGLMLPHQLFENVCTTQRLQCTDAKKLINRNRCECQNKAREHQGRGKGNNRKNKWKHPSGFKSSRFTQHM